MSILQSSLRAAAGRSTIQKSVTARVGQRTAFLCHSHVDATLALGLQQTLREHGLDLYIDWQDSAMPDSPNAETAARLRLRIRQAELFFFLATSNSMSSRWCPWELGFADSTKDNRNILVVPTSDGYSTHGSEYLQLYRRVDFAESNALGVFPPGANQGIFAKNL